MASQPRPGVLVIGAPLTSPVEPVPPSTSDATASTADPRRHNFFLSRRDFSLWTKNYCFDHRGHRVPYTRKYWIARMKKKPKVTKFVWMFIQVFLFDAVVPGSDLSFAARDCFAAHPPNPSRSTTLLFFQPFSTSMDLFPRFILSPLPAACGAFCSINKQKQE